jgi:hypothetical protein
VYSEEEGDGGKWEQGQISSSPEKKRGCKTQNYFEKLK